MRRFIVVLIVIAAIVGGGLWWNYSRNNTPAPTSDIFGSGFIEAMDVSIATEITGRIVSISADEGSEVKAGVTLVKLDDSLLKAHMGQAEAAVKVAQSGLDQATAARDKALVSRDSAKNIWDITLSLQNNPQELQTRIATAKGEMQMAEVALERLDYQISATSPERQPSFWAWDQRLAKVRYDTAKAILANLEEIRKNPLDVAASVEKARAAYLDSVAAVDVANKAIELAKTQVEQARSSIEVLKVQLNKTSVISPVSGVVVSRNAEPGEVAQPGAPLLSISFLDKVTLTAYVPEKQIGLVKLGQKAFVSVDSFPGQTFPGEITFISPRAIFTPSNVQLKDEREKTVFAVKITLNNTDRKLKPGMPVDAQIVTDVSR